jgi:hypothetical protein
VTPFEGYIYELAPTSRISVRHSEWSYPPRGHVASRCTHTHTHLFHLLLSYVSYTGEAGISGADSAFAEERWIEVDVTDSIDIRARKEHRSFFKNFLQSLGLIICSIPETRCLVKSSCTFSRSRTIFRACDIVVLDGLLASSLNPCPMSLPRCLPLALRIVSQKSSEISLHLLAAQELQSYG